MKLLGSYELRELRAKGGEPLGRFLRSKGGMIKAKEAKSYGHNVSKINSFLYEP